MATQQANSFLAADFGSITTRVVLVDVVDGQYRLVARASGRTSIGYPLDNVNVALHQIVKNVGELTGRSFVDGAGNIITPEDANRHGVDYFLTTASAGRPMRAVIAGLMPDISIKTARRVLNAASIQVADVVHVSDDRDEEARVNAFILNTPDLIFICGGTDGGATEQLQAMIDHIRLAVEVLPQVLRPFVIYAGNATLAGYARDTLSPHATIIITPNIRPFMDRENTGPARFALGQAYDAYASKENYGTSFRAIAENSASGILPTAPGYAVAVEYFSRLRQQDVLAIDVGSSSTILAGTFGGVTDVIVAPATGVGHGAARLIEQVNLDDIHNTLPFYATDDIIEDYALNKTLHPAMIPLGLRDLYIEHALVRAAVQLQLDEARRTWSTLPEHDPVAPGLIISAGAPLTGTGNPAYDLLLVADSVQPVGIVDVKADPHGLLAAVGAIAGTHPEAVAQLLDGPNLDHLGTIVAADGEARVGRPAMSLKIKTQDGEVYEHVINGGDVFALPLQRTGLLDVRIKLHGNLRINGRRSLRAKLSGGSAGLLFDARGRGSGMWAPTVEDRAQSMPRNIEAATGDPMHAIPDTWLQPLPDAEKSRQRTERARRRAQEAAADKPEKEPAAVAVDDDDPFARVLDDTGGDTRGDTGSLRNLTDK